MKLVIVESPAKAKTIGNFLGKDYKVVASYGHVRDLPSSADEIPEKIRGEKWARLAVNTSKNFEPIYVVTSSSKKHVNEMKTLLKDAEELILATDEDREGESISWHLLEVLKPKVPVTRIAFHEITKTAIQEALSKPRQVDQRLVRAQESRRILDRLFGYGLSPVLWKKVRTKLSAGRVQSVAVRLLVDREEARRAFKQSVYWDIEAMLKGADLEFPATLHSVSGKRVASGKDFDPDTGTLKGTDVVALGEAAARRLAGLAGQHQPWRVTSVERKEQRQRPSPPFITSTLQQAASSVLGFSPRRTMEVAQRLYEGIDMGKGEREGLITYMRTDSTNLSEKALQEAGPVILREYGAAFHSGPRTYTTKARNAQEAHEAIRPTVLARKPNQVAQYLKEDELRLYTLIWNRMIASQMTDAVLEKTAVVFEVNGGGEKLEFKSNGSVVKFPGFLAVMGTSRDTILPPLKEGQAIGEGQAVIIDSIEPQRHETQPPGRYTEASLIRKLEEEGIGRPSTYAPTIGTIQQRGYVGKKGSALYPTFLGIAVVRLLRDHFERYIDYKFTARMEDQLDEIANGDTDWVDFLTQFYFGDQKQQARGLEQEITERTPAIDYPAIPLGEDPATGKQVYVKIGRATPYIILGEDGNATKAYITDEELTYDELTVERALELLASAPQTGSEGLGVDPETKLTVYLLDGPYGPYVQLGEAVKGKKPLRTSLPKGADPNEYGLEEALRLLHAVQRGEQGIGNDPTTGEMIYVLDGPFGPYVQLGKTSKKNPKPRRASLPKGMAMDEVTLQVAVQLLSLPRELGTHPKTGKPIQAGKGRFGPYISHDGDFRSLTEDDDVFTVGLERALELLAQPKKAGPPGKRAKAAASKRGGAGARAKRKA